MLIVLLGLSRHYLHLIVLYFMAALAGNIMVWGRKIQQQWHAKNPWLSAAWYHPTIQGVNGVHPNWLWLAIFPRASERRVLPIVGVCISSSHLHIFSSSHFFIFTSSHLHIFLSSHLLIFTSAHLHIFLSSHLLIFTSAHLHICSSSRLLIFTSSHLHTFSSSHLLIFTSSHLHIFTSSHPHIFTSSPLALLPSSSHLLILTSSHLHIFITSSHPHILTSSPLALLPSCSLLLFYFSSEAGAGAVQTRRHETQPFRTKRGSITKNWSKIVIPKSSSAILSHEMRFDRQKLR